jgi:glutamate/tyrosine decarboxylase-like PLP-dependent enzyme
MSLDDATATLLADAARRATRYLDGLDARGVAPSPTALAANWLAGAWDQNAALARVTPGVARLEDVALAWLKDLFGLPASTEGAFVTGATLANFTALAAARHAVLKRVGWNVEADGLFGAPPITVLVGEEAHPTLLKSLGLLGLGRTRLTRVPVDGAGRLRADALPRLTGPTILCLQAGNLNTGAFDPCDTICPVARAAGAWVHVDGAFGLWARATPTLAPLAAGLELADSWATDAHKWLNVPYDSGIAFVREPGVLPAAMAITADYLPTEPAERNCRQAKRFATRLAAAGFEIVNDVQLNQVLVSFGDPATTLRVIDAVQRDGTCWCGSTVWQGRTAMRISVCSWATTDADVELSSDAIVAAAARVAVAGR